MDSAVDEIGKQYGDSMINRIKKGLKPKLATWTIIKDAASPISRISDKPLMRTGNLLRSLKYKKSSKSINMLAYGKEQNDGIDPNTWAGFRPVPARPFMHHHYRSSYNYSEKEIKSKLYSKIRKGLII